MHTRSKILSRNYFKKIVGLKEDISSFKFDFFNEGIRAGNKLTYNELKKVSVPFPRSEIHAGVRQNSDLLSYN